MAFLDDAKQILCVRAKKGIWPRVTSPKIFKDYDDIIKQFLQRGQELFQNVTNITVNDIEHLYYNTIEIFNSEHGIPSDVLGGDKAKDIILPTFRKVEKEQKWFQSEICDVFCQRDETCLKTLLVNYVHDAVDSLPPPHHFGTDQSKEYERTSYYCGINGLNNWFRLYKRERLNTNKNKRDEAFIQLCGGKFYDAYIRQHGVLSQIASNEFFMWDILLHVLNRGQKRWPTFWIDFVNQCPNINYAIMAYYHFTNWRTSWNSSDADKQFYPFPIGWNYRERKIGRITPETHAQYMSPRQRLEHPDCSG